MSLYFETLNSAFLAHFSRRLSDLIIDQGTKLLEQKGIVTPTTAISTIYFLDKNSKVTLADLAKALDVTHQMVTQRIQTLEKLGLVYRQANPEDKRAKTLHLTELGAEEAIKLKPFTKQVSAAFDSLNEQLGCDLMAKIREAELALIEKPMSKRIEEEGA